jgi:hypothetical protein
MTLLIIFIVIISIVNMEYQMSAQEALAMKAGEYEQQLDQLSKELMLWYYS